MVISEIVWLSYMVDAKKTVQTRTVKTKNKKQKLWLQWISQSMTSLLWNIGGCMCVPRRPIISMYFAFFAFYFFWWQVVEIVPICHSQSHSNVYLWKIGIPVQLYHYTCMYISCVWRINNKRGNTRWQVIHKEREQTRERGRETIGRGQ